MSNFKIVNGRWVNAQEERINLLEAIELESTIIKVRYFVGNKKLSSDKIDIIMSVLHNNPTEDRVMLEAVNSLN
jgi:hypothetical protein